jgi:hypothetical protein
MEGSLTIFINDPESGYSVVLDDDGRVVYAYLRDAGNKIVGDVWLFNRIEAPSIPEWTSPERAPFANPADYVRHIDNLHVDDLSDFEVSWGRSRDGSVQATIVLKGTRFAVLAEGSKPGWSILTAKDGPLARALTGAEVEG